MSDRDASISDAAFEEGQVSAMPERVKRYEPDERAEGGACMVPSEYGLWVDIDDYATLESRLLAAEAERDKWERISHGHFERAEKAEAKNHDDAVALADKMNTRRDEVLGQLDESWRYERDRANAAEARVADVEAAMHKYRRDCENAEARVRELQAPVMCSVCVGRPLPSGKPCICGDTVRTEAAEMHGLRVRCFELEDENEKLEARVREVEADLKAAQELEQLHLQNLDTAYADREALAHHLLRYGWHAADCPFLQDTLPCTCGLGAAETQARAILAREVGE